MNLYEVTNGWTGESYVRCYVWAEDEAAALELAGQSFRQHRQAKEHPSVYEDLQIEKLFSADDPPFATAVSDSGWERVASE